MIGVVLIHDLIRRVPQFCRDDSNGKVFFLWRWFANRIQFALINNGIADWLIKLNGHGDVCGI